MTKEVTPEPRKTKRDELVDALELNYVSMALHHSNRAIAERIVDRVIQTGWQWHPPKLEDFDLDHNMVAFPDPTPEQEIDIIDRIISGLPMEYVKPANPNGNAVYEKEPKKLYDVNSLYPEEFKLTPKMKLTHERKADALIAAANSWERIPEFDNYEVNPLGVIRSRWTKRVIEVTEDGDQKYVAMHDGQGFEHAVNVNFVMEKVYKK